MHSRKDTDDGGPLYTSPDILHMDRMDYVEEMRQKGGRRESLDLEEMLRENQALFAGGTISEEAKDAYFQAVMKAYLECKEAAKETYGRKKKTAPDKQ